MDEGIARAHHALIRWDQYPTYDGRTVTLTGTLLGDAVLSAPRLDLAQAGGGYSNFTVGSATQEGYLGSILPPLPGNAFWTLEDPADIVATTFELDEQAGTFAVTFAFPAGLDAPKDYVIIVWGYQDEEREARTGTDVDILGYARIRVE